MFRTFSYLFIFLAFYQVSNAQVRVIKPVKTHPTQTKLGIGVGFTNSDLFLARNNSERNNAFGFTSSLVYGISRTFRLSMDYTHYSTIDIAPTWYEVKANTIELNAHIVYKGKGDFYFYPLFGLSYNRFAGFFTGKNDHLNLTSIYPSNEDVITRWLGLNAGIGLEYSFKPMVVFAGYKMRVGISEGYNTINILDVCFNLGVRYNLIVPSIYNLFKGTKRRYFIDKKDVL